MTNDKLISFGAERRRPSFLFDQHGELSFERLTESVFPFVTLVVDRCQNGLSWAVRLSDFTNVPIPHSKLFHVFHYFLLQNIVAQK